MTTTKEKIDALLDQCFDGSQRPTHNFDDENVTDFFGSRPVTHPVVNPLAGLYLVFGEDYESDLGFGHLFGVAMTADGAKRLATIEVQDQFECWLFDGEQNEFQPQVKVEYRTVNVNKWREIAEEITECANCLFCDETGDTVHQEDFDDDEDDWD